MCTLLDNRALAFWLSLALLAVVSVIECAHARETAKAYRIGFLASGHRPTNSLNSASALSVFRQSLRVLGYVEGQNLVIEERWAEGRADDLPALAAELINLDVDVIVASGVSAVWAAKHASERIPIVIAGSADPVAEGLVESLAHPGANVTGIAALPGRELEGKRLELLQEVVPDLKRVAVVMDSTSRLDPDPLRDAAHALGLTLYLSGETQTSEEFRYTFAEMARQNIEAVYAPETPVNVRQRRLLTQLALKHRIPTIYGAREFVEEGGLMAYGPSFSELFRRAAIYTDRILNGANPGDLPVEQPMRLELVINTETARQLGVEFPPSILVRVDEKIHSGQSE